MKLDLSSQTSEAEMDTLATYSGVCVSGEKGMLELSPEQLWQLRADLDDSDKPFRIGVVPWSKAPPHLREAMGRASVTIQN